MAQKYAMNVLLGYEDELILEKHQDTVNFTTNKIGGKPDWPSSTSDIKVPICPLCELPRLFVLQIYAPFENTSYHRTLYLFACINSNCWNQNESWLCLRSQILDQNTEITETTTTSSKNTLSVTDWCQDADDWDDDNNANMNEENGNVINPPPPPPPPGASVEHPSDDEEESYSFEEVVRASFGQLTVDERNANTGGFVAEMQGGAVGRQSSPIATAEIEGDESELVTIDSPIVPQRDITALLHETTPLPPELCQRTQNALTSLQFVPAFISVMEECFSGNGALTSDHHIRDLLQEYQQNNDELNSDVAQTDGASVEKYEKSVPAHGDKLFHHFLSRVQMNPGHILRYSRGGPAPLLLHPLQDIPKTCRHCQGELSFEFQVLPTLIPKLRLQNVKDNTIGGRIEFGTVLVFTCNRSCWSSDNKIRDEIVVVQAEKY